MAFVDVGLAVVASVARPAQAGKGGYPILAGPVVAGVGVALIDVHLTVGPRVAFCAHTAVGIGSVQALGAILARCAGTLVHIVLAQVSCEARGALAVKFIDLVHTAAILQAGAAGTLICVHLTVHALIARHADALELPDLVQAGGVILTRVGDTLVDVDLAAGTRVALQTLALEGTQGVDALARVFTRVGTQ